MEVHHEKEVSTSIKVSDRIHVLQKFKFVKKSTNIASSSMAAKTGDQNRQISASSAEVLVLASALARDPSLGGIAETLMEGSVARGTISAYSGPIEDFILFCTNQGYALEFTSDVLRF